MGSCLDAAGLRRHRRGLALLESIRLQVLHEETSGREDVRTRRRQRHEEADGIHGAVPVALRGGAGSGGGLVLRWVRGDGYL